jgi:hypothetical protein
VSGYVGSCRRGRVLSATRPPARPFDWRFTNKCERRQLVDLTDLLVEHGLKHLDLHEITTSRRVVTQTIAADLFDRGASAVRFPSRRDGGACVALFEGRGTVAATDDVIALPIRRPNRSPPSQQRGAHNPRLGTDS